MRRAPCWLGRPGSEEQIKAKEALFLSGVFSPGNDLPRVVMIEVRPNLVDNILGAIKGEAES